MTEVSSVPIAQCVHRAWKASRDLINRSVLFSEPIEYVGCGWTPVAAQNRVVPMPAGAATQVKNILR